MPDLGKYAVEVLAAYGVTLVLLAGIVALSLYQARRSKRDLNRFEGHDDA